MTQEEFLDLLRKYRVGSCTSLEKKIIEDWFAALSSDTEPFSNAEDEFHLKERMWKGVEQNIGEVRKAPGARRKAVFLRWSLAAAATLLMLLAAFLYINKKPFGIPVSSESSVRPGLVERTVANDGPEPRELFLPDGSRIRLLSRSKISFSPSFQGEKREISLDGEAFFDVAHDVSRPFLVYTNALTTEVRGTSFFIKAYREQTEIVVTVQTGKVSVYKNISADSGPGRHDEVILTPNQQVVYNTGDRLTLKKLVNEPQIILPQPTLKDSYTNAPVIEILSSLEENYGIDIRYDEKVLSNCTLTSDMSDEGFYEQIKIICNALGARHTVEESAVVIEATGCSAIK